MIVEKIRNATTAASAVQYEITIRIREQELEDPLYAKKLAGVVRRAIVGVSYPEQTGRDVPWEPTPCELKMGRIS